MKEILLLASAMLVLALADGEARTPGAGKWCTGGSAVQVLSLR